MKGALYYATFVVCVFKISNRSGTPSLVAVDLKMELSLLSDKCSNIQILFFSKVTVLIRALFRSVYANYTVNFLQTV